MDPGTTLPGDPAPRFTLTDQYRTPVTLSRFRGHAVVLAFVDARWMRPSAAGSRPTASVSSWASRAPVMGQPGAGKTILA